MDYPKKKAKWDNKDGERGGEKKTQESDNLRKYIRWVAFAAFILACIYLTPDF